MALRALAAVPVLLCGGCTIVLDPDNLPPQTDARPIDARSIDADPSQLTIDRAEPSMIFEGTGAGGGRPALLVLHGRSLVGSAVVTAELVGGAGSATVDGFAAAVDGTQAALAVRIPVLTDLAAGATRTLRLTVTQGTARQSKDVTVMGLGELTLPGVITEPQYSRIEVSGPVHFTGSEPIRLIAIADIEISAKLDGNATGQSPGPHGCPGGEGGAPGSCTPGGGQAGTGALGGGGGGGFGAPGNGGGGGTSGGMPGAVTGRDTLVPIVSAAGVAGNRGNGGGGGAGGALGGKGGGGGGVVYLDAGGDVVVLGSGAIEVKGGDATSGTGGGGGGSGGAILLRAGGTLTVPAGRLSAPGGGVANGNGGVGGLGRIRVDAAGGDLAAVATSPMAFRGPSWKRDTPSLVDRPASETSLTLLGQPGRGFGLRLNDRALATTATPGADGSAEVGDLPLVLGRNRLCAVVEPGQLQPESLSCIELFSTGR